MKLSLITFTESGAIRYRGGGNYGSLPLQSDVDGVVREVRNEDPQAAGSIDLFEATINLIFSPSHFQEYF